MDDDLENVQRYRAGIRSSYGRSLSWFEPLYPYYYQGSHRVAVVLARDKLAKIEVALSNWEDTR